MTPTPFFQENDFGKMVVGKLHFRKPHSGKTRGDICKDLCDHRYSQNEHQHNHDESKLEPPWPQIVWPVVHHATDKGFNTAKLGVNPKGEQHKEKEDSPKG